MIYRWIIHGGLPIFVAKSLDLSWRQRKDECLRTTAGGYAGGDAIIRYLRALACHREATLGATSTGPHAVVHIADALAILCAFGANFRTFSADVLVVGRIQKHKVRGSAANFGACHHEPEMFRFDVLASGLETMRHGRSETRLIAAQAFVDAGLHIFAHMFHSYSLQLKSRSPALQSSNSDRRLSFHRLPTWAAQRGVLSVGLPPHYLVETKISLRP
jgi:hypothetical protein